ncbi:YggS family pyridoxal phosphate-dependent enzyme [Christensenellaceae bacterium NSJ-44]|uniref:Pyridoxal phosphate homeostasis protein n=1 Tax=Luoshenia tenuis TaxID=2763654 RepID=A0A926CZG4_9FIRM|nr:YggS family pyridoxal phosphate-dependent enzyme [Luoshenia tenuis]MBC8528759.1 YggS family pyridoxal phosphate-dependent enzyme [Luoshenia tenuis]
MTAQIPQNIAQVFQRMEEAKVQAGRTDTVRLIAATKTQSPEIIDLAAQYGVKEVGENRVQELKDKFPAVSSDLKWHFIGQLQVNKVKYILEQVVMIHSLDRIALAQEIEKRAAKAGLVMPVLVQVNIGREMGKGGVAPDEVESFIRQIAPYEHLSVQGLMAVPPAVPESEQARPYFKAMREMLLALRDKQIPHIQMRELSIGMSHDYEVAIQEGATMVRVGSAIFGKRNYLV